MERVAAGVVQHMVGRAAERFVDYQGLSDVDTMTSLKRSMGVLRSQAMDIEAEVKHEEMSCKKKMKTEVKNWLKEENDLQAKFEKFEAQVSSSGRPLIRDPVGEMQSLANKLMDERNHFNGLVLNDSDNIGVPCPPPKLFGNKTKETLKRIWPCLVVDDISNIGIYGMGGVGKTTLVKHIKCELEGKNYCVYWVTVSQEFSVTSLQDKIANVLGIKLSNEDEEHMRANILRAAFEKMEKSVFIFDDVWKEFHLEDVGITIGPNKCRLIWTTRSETVCDRMRCQRKFKVPILDEAESWRLFKDTLGHILPEEVEKVAKSVANRCAGLPLGIVTTAGSMRGITNIDEWNIALEKLKSCSDEYYEMEDEVFPILEWSFKRLRGCERPCFLYCCLYPEDHEIEREQLIDLFILAELIPRRDTMELERAHGIEILNKLVKVCLLEECKAYDKECVKMHDLVRDMALRITCGKCISNITEQVPMFLVKNISRNKSNNLLLKNEEWKDDLAAVSLWASSTFFDGILEIPPLMSPNCQSLSTLIINGVNITEIPDSFLRHMNGLKVLYLQECGLRRLPNCISDLVNITALLLDGCRFVESIPSLEKLKKLRILNLFRTYVHNVPQGLEELVNLERLYMGSFINRDGPGAILPEGTFSKLDRLHHLVLPTAAVHISDLRLLHDLQLYVGGVIHDQFSNSGWWPANYMSVVLSPDANEFSSDSIQFLSYHSDFVENWMTFDNHLLFERYNLQKGLDLILPQEYLHRLDLSRCSGFSHHLIDRSKHLSHLALRHSKELKFVLNLSFLDADDEGATLNLEGALRNLEILDLEDLPNLVGIINIGRESGGSLVPPGTFSSLEELNILRCHKLKKVLSMQLVKQCLQNLKYLEVRNCNGVEEIVAKNDDHDLNGGAIISRPSLGGHIASTSQELLLPKLEVLRLLGLPKLENVCSPTIMIGGEKPIIFTLFGSPNFKRLPFFRRLLSEYSLFCGSKQWWNSLEWDNPSDKDAVQPFFKDTGR